MNDNLIVQALVTKSGWWGNEDDIYTHNVNTNCWEFYCDTNNVTRTIIINQEVMNVLIESDAVRIIKSYSIEDLVEMNNKLMLQIAKIEDTLNDAINNANQIRSNAVNEYSIGIEKECVKVEAETVYHNLLTLATEIKKIINE